MHQFVDSAGREWVVRVTLGTLRQLRDGGLDLLTLPQSDDELPPLVRVFSDSELLERVLTCVLRQQLAQHGVAADAVADLFDAQTLSAAVEALSQELEDFFRWRPELTRLLTMIRRLDRFLPPEGAAISGGSSTSSRA